MGGKIHTKLATHTKIFQIFRVTYAVVQPTNPACAEMNAKDKLEKVGMNAEDKLEKVGKKDSSR